MLEGLVTCPPLLLLFEGVVIVPLDEPLLPLPLTALLFPLAALPEPLLTEPGVRFCVLLFTVAAEFPVREPL